MDYQIRLSSAEYRVTDETELTFSQAVARARSLEDRYTYVVAVYPEAFDEEIHSYKGTKISHREAGEAVFGYRVSVNGRRKDWDDGHRPAEVNWSALGATAPENAALYAKLIAIAADIATAANA